jgi:hypothetical protein
MVCFTPINQVQQEIRIMQINHIAIPPQFVAIAGDWYGGQSCMLYAVSSTGGLTTGTNRPYDEDTDYPATDEKWYYDLWVELSSDVGYAAKCAEKGCNGSCDRDDAVELRKFEDWIDNNILPRLEREYGIE